MARGKWEDGNASGAKESATIQRVVGGMAFSLLTKTNYLNWAMHMRMTLKARILLVIVDKRGVKPQEDMMVLDTLVSAVPPETVTTVVDKSSAKEAWDAIATMCISDERVKKAASQ
jgi:hypothetical protein